MTDSRKAPEVLRFDYLKSALHRVIHVDGVVGGTNTKGRLTISVWNERLPIPQQVTHRVDVDAENQASLGDELLEQRLTRKTIVREVECTLMMDLATAESLHDWLGVQMGRAKELIAARDVKDGQ